MPTRNRLNLTLIACLVVMAGCSGSEPTVTLLEREYVALMDATGRRSVVPADEITNHGTEDRTAWKVLVIDRRSGRERWIPLDELYGQPPALATYIPVTRTDPQEFSSRPD